MNDDQLRRLYREALSERRTEARAGCVSAERLVALAEGRLPEPDALSTAEHAMACAHCRDEYALVRAMHESRPVPARGLNARLAMAASVVMLIGSVALWQGVRWRDAARQRGAGTQVLLIEPDARADSPVSLNWHTVPGAARYEVELLDEAGETTHRATTRDTLLLLPDRVRMLAGARHSWWVRAIFADGRELRSSMDTFRVR